MENLDLISITVVVIVLIGIYIFLRLSRYRLQKKIKSINIHIMYRLVERTRGQNVSYIIQYKDLDDEWVDSEYYTSFEAGNRQLLWLTAPTVEKVIAYGG